MSETLHQFCAHRLSENQNLVCCDEPGHAGEHRYVDTKSEKKAPQRTGLIRNRRVVSNVLVESCVHDVLAFAKECGDRACRDHIATALSDGRSYIHHYDVSGPYQRPDHDWEISAIGWVALADSKDAAVGETANLAFLSDYDGGIGTAYDDAGHLFQTVVVQGENDTFVIGERVV